MKLHRASILAALWLPLAAAAAPALTLSYGDTHLDLSLADIAALPHLSIAAMDGHEKKMHVYSGVPVHDLLEKLGVPSGEKFRGKQLGLVVLAKARDGYTVAYALAEFDPNFSDRTILLVDRQDGAPLPAALGPLRIMAPGDKRPARWERMVDALEIVRPSP